MVFKDTGLSWQNTTAILSQSFHYLRTDGFTFVLPSVLAILINVYTLFLLSVSLSFTHIISYTLNYLINHLIGVFRHLNIWNINLGETREIRHCDNTIHIIQVHPLSTLHSMSCRGPSDKSECNNMIKNNIIYLNNFVKKI